MCECVCNIFPTYGLHSSCFTDSDGPCRAYCKTCDSSEGGATKGAKGEREREREQQGREGEKYREVTERGRERTVNSEH